MPNESLPSRQSATGAFLWDKASGRTVCRPESVGTWKSQKATRARVGSRQCRLLVLLPCASSRVGLVQARKRDNCLGGRETAVTALRRCRLTRMCDGGVLVLLALAQGSSTGSAPKYSQRKPASPKCVTSRTRRLVIPRTASIHLNAAQNVNSDRHRIVPCLSALELLACSAFILLLQKSLQEQLCPTGLRCLAPNGVTRTCRPIGAADLAQDIAWELSTCRRACRWR